MCIRDSVYAVAAGEGVRLDDVADVESVAVVEAELPQRALGSHVRFLKMSLHGLVDPVDGHVAETELQRVVPVVGHRFLLDHDAGAGFCLLYTSRCV